MKHKISKIFKMTLSIGLIVSIMSGTASAVIYTMDGFTEGTETTEIVIAADGNVVKEKIPRPAEANADKSQKDDVITEETFTYQIPQIKTAQYDLYSRIEDGYKIYRAADENGNDIENVKLANGEYKYFVVQKNMPSSAPSIAGVKAGTKAVVAERNADGSLILADENNDGIADLSDAYGFVTAETYWNGYLFTVWSFQDSMSADYVTNLVVWDLDDLRKPVAEYNLRDMGLLYDWYRDGMTIIDDKSSFRTTSGKKGINGTTYSRENDWNAPTIEGIYVDDDYLAMRVIHQSPGCSNWSNNWMHATAGAPAGWLDVKLFKNPMKNGEGAEIEAIDTINIKSSFAYGEYWVAEGNGNVSEAVASGGNQNLLQLNPNITKVGDYLIDVYTYAGMYNVYSVENGNINQAFSMKPADFNAVLGESGMAKGSIYDVKFEGSAMYIVYNGGTSFKIAKVDISKPLKPALVWKTAIDKTKTGNGTTTAALSWPKLSINGKYGVLYDAGNLRGDESSTAWFCKILLDMSDRSKAPAELMRYDTKETRRSVDGTLVNYQANRGFSVVYGDYLFDVTARYRTGKTGVALTKLSEDGKSVDIVDYMKISDTNGYRNIPCGVSQYEGKIFVYMKRNNNGANAATGRVLVLEPDISVYASEINAPKLNDDGSITLSGYIAKTPMGRFESYTQNLYIQIGNKRYEITNWNKETGEWEYTINYIKQGELYDIKVYGNLVYDDQERDENDKWVIVKREELLDRYYDYTEFTVGTKVYDINDYNFDAENKKVTVSYELAEGEESITGRPILALYKDGVLVNVNYGTEDVTLESGIGLTAEVLTPADWTSAQGASVRMFIWNSETISPLANDVEKEIE